MRILSLDVGEKRIGVARADSNTRIAVPIGFINVDGSEWQEIARLARLNNTNLFILGLPRSNEGNETAQSRYVRNFAKALSDKIPGAKIKFQDESLTSVEAENRLKVKKKKYIKGDIDAEAAAIILQDFLEGLSGKNPSSASRVRGSSLPSSRGSALSGLDSDLRQAPPGTTQVPAEETQGETHAKKKPKKALKIFSLVMIVVILALIATGAALFIRDQRYKEYAKQFEEIESQMKAEVFNFTVKPGESIYDIKRELLEVGYSETEIDEAFSAHYNFPFLQGRPEGATLEGYLFGETHEFYAGTPVKEVLEVFLQGMGEVIKENGLEERYAAQGLSLYEGITLASVVQKEASSPEQPTVAQVFLSRLSLGIPLGSDVTVSYALDTVDPDRETYTDNQVALSVNSCYNTRLYTGLPCGPISNPGISALLAVAEPSDSSYLYFLTGDDGLMYYSYTESEHIQNIYSHCQVLCNEAL